MRALKFNWTGEINPVRVQKFIVLLTFRPLSTTSERPPTPHRRVIVPDSQMELRRHFIRHPSLNAQGVSIPNPNLNPNSRPTFFLPSYLHNLKIPTSNPLKPLLSFLQKPHRSSYAVLNLYMASLLSNSVNADVVDLAATKSTHFNTNDIKTNDKDDDDFRTYDQETTPER